jgi:hypothetical protein
MLEAEYVVVAEVPSTEGEGSGALDRKHATFCKAIKMYHLHVQKVKDTSETIVDATALTHYGGVPYEALYSGFFVHEAALQLYMCMFEAESGLALAAETKAANEALLVKKLATGFTSGVHTEGSSFLSGHRDYLALFSLVLGTWHLPHMGFCALHCKFPCKPLHRHR